MQITREKGAKDVQVEVKLDMTATEPKVIILTNRHNLVMGIQRQMKLYSKFSERKDLTEYTMYMRVDPGKIVWDDALVIASV